jgi:cytochrome P450
MQLISSQVGARRPPVVNGLPIIGNILPLMHDSFGFFFAQSLRMGSAYQVRVLNKIFTVLAGREAQELMSANDGKLTSWKTWEGVISEFGGRKLVGMVDGEEHGRYRRVLRQGMSRATITNNLPTLFQVVQNALEEFEPGERIQVMPFLRRIVSTELGTLALGVPPGDYLKDFYTYWSTLLQVRLAKALPESKLQTPEYRQARARVEEMVQQIAAQARNGQIKGGESNLATDILHAMETDPDLFDEREMLFHLMIPYIAGLDTVANTLGFMLYHVLSDKTLLARVQTEIDQLFEGDTPGANDMRAMETLHATAMETMRLYPIAATLIRYASETFEFAGYQINKDERLMIIPAATHFDPQYFKDPTRFDPDRFLAPRSEHKQRGVYSPYMGASMAEVQVPLTLAALLHHARLEIDPSGHRLQRTYDPSLSPGKGFFLKLKSRP